MDATGATLLITGRAPIHAKVKQVNALELKNNAYVDVGSVSGAPTGDTKRAICLWVRPDSVSSSGGVTKPILQYSDSYANTGQALILFAETDGFAVDFNGARLRADIAGGIVTEQWYHVAVVVPNGAVYVEDVEIVVDGERYSIADQNATRTGTVGLAINTQSVNVSLGRAILGSTTVYGDCAVSDARVYSVPPNNFDTIMNGELGTSLKAVWPLAEGAGEVAYDVFGSADGAHVNSPTWITADGIPSYNLRYGHSKTLLFDGSSYLQTDKVYDIDYDVDWGFECTFTMLELPSSGNHYYLLGMDGDDRFAIRIDSSGNTKVLLGGDPQTSGDWTSFTTGFAAGTKYNLKVEFSKSDQEVSVQVDGGTATVTTPASNAYASGLVLFGKAEGAAGFEGIIHDIKWTYELTHQKKYTALFPVSKGYGTTLPDEKTSHVKEDLLFSGPQWLYLPSTTGGVVDALHGDTLTNGIGAFHNNAEAKLDFTGDEPNAPWLYDRVVPGDAATAPYAFGDKRGIVEKATDNSIHLRKFSEYGIDVSRILLFSAMVDAISHARTLGNVAGMSTLALDERTWVVEDPLTFNFDEAFSINGFGASVEQAFAYSQGPLFKWAGSLATKHALETGDDHSQSGQDFVRCSGIVSSLSPNEWLVIEGTSPLQGFVPNGTYNFAGEIHKVNQIISTDTIILRNDLIDTMTGGNGGTVQKMTPLSGVNFKGVTISNSYTGAVGDFYASVEFDLCVDVEIENITFSPGCQGGIRLKRIADFTVKNLDIDNVKSTYGIELSGGSYGIIETYCGRRMNHVMTTGATRSEGAGFDNRWGTPRDVTMRFFDIRYDETTVRESCLDTHGEGFDLTLEKSYVRIPVVYSGKNAIGIQSRCRAFHVVDTIVRGVGTWHNDLQRGIKFVADGCTMSGCTIIDVDTGVEVASYSATPYIIPKNCELNDSRVWRNFGVGLRLFGEKNEANSNYFRKNGRDATPPGGFRFIGLLLPVIGSENDHNTVEKVPGFTNGNIFIHDANDQTSSIGSATSGQEDGHVIENNLFVGGSQSTYNLYHTGPLAWILGHNSWAQNHTPPSSIQM
ncbi:MAG: LamG-like jellyroll fold domain-containing protein [Pirellulaceae bacterium]